MAEERFTDEEIIDRQMAAIHELGHTFMLAHYGIVALPRIYPNHSRQHPDAPSWRGYTDYRRSDIRTSMRRRRVAIAGLVAEEIASFESPKECSEANVIKRLRSTRGETYNEMSGWSRSDWDGSRGLTDRDISVVYAVLIKKWQDLVEYSLTILSGSYKA